MSHLHVGGKNAISLVKLQHLSNSYDGLPVTADMTHLYDDGKDAEKET